MLGCGQETDLDLDVVAADEFVVEQGLFGNSTRGVATLAPVGAGDISEGNRTVSTANTILNRYAQLNADIAPGARTLQLFVLQSGNPRPFVAGDLVMIHRFAGRTSLPASSTGPTTITAEDVGFYEFARIATIAGNVAGSNQPSASRRSNALSRSAVLGCRLGAPTRPSARASAQASSSQGNAATMPT